MKIAAGKNSNVAFALGKQFYLKSAYSGCSCLNMIPFFKDREIFSVSFCGGNGKRDESARPGSLSDFAMM
jgi:hypothetical protein